MGTIGTVPGDRLAGLSADLFHKLQKGVISIDELALFTQRKNPFSSNFAVTVDYEESLAVMMAKGDYAFDIDITAYYFHREEEGVVERPVFLRHYNRPMTYEEVLMEMDAVDEEPATIEDLLAFGAKYPEEQLKYEIVALGSPASGTSRRVPYLSKNGSKRGLELYRVERGWHGNFKFLARKKAPDPTLWGFHGRSRM